MEVLILLSEYEVGVQVWGWEGVNHPTPSASSHCVLRLNLIKGSFNIVIYTPPPPPHTHQHTSSNQHSINHPKTLTYIYHGNSYQTQHTSIMHIISFLPRQPTNKISQGYKYGHGSKVLKPNITQTSKHSIQESKNIFIVFIIQNACSCKYMTYPTYLTASQHLCINA